MQQISRSELVRLVMYVNRNFLTPLILWGTRQSKQDLIRALRRYWKSRKSRTMIFLTARIQAPDFSFDLLDRRWNFELSPAALSPLSEIPQFPVFLDQSHPHTLEL